MNRWRSCAHREPYAVYIQDQVYIAPPFTWTWVPSTEQKLNIINTCILSGFGCMETRAHTQGTLEWRNNKNLPESSSSRHTESQLQLRARRLVLAEHPRPQCTQSRGFDTDTACERIVFILFYIYDCQTRRLMNSSLTLQFSGFVGFARCARGFFFSRERQKKIRRNGILFPYSFASA